MSKIKLGAYNTLTVQKVALREGNGDPFGLYLDGGPAGEILMPQKYVPEGTQIGDEIEAFVYLHDRETTGTGRRLRLSGMFVGQ